MREAGSSSVSSPKAVQVGPGARPKYVEEDFQTVVAKIRYDLTSAQAKLSELKRMFDTISLPTEDAPFNEERFLQFVRNTAHVYTDSSLADEARIQGAPAEFIERALAVAAEVRG